MLFFIFVTCLFIMINLIYFAMLSSFLITIYKFHHSFTNRQYISFFILLCLFNFNLLQLTMVFIDHYSKYLYWIISYSIHRHPKLVRKHLSLKENSHLFLKLMLKWFETILEIFISMFSLSLDVRKYLCKTIDIIFKFVLFYIALK